MNSLIGENFLLQPPDCDHLDPIDLLVRCGVSGLPAETSWDSLKSRCGFALSDAIARRIAGPARL